MRIAVSACLLGEPCRYDGEAKPCKRVIEFTREHEVLPICPEVAGGLPIPHPACEVAGENPLRVIDCTGAEVTEAFERGAEETLRAVRAFRAEMAILKAKSPSCGTGRIYDGTFTGTLCDGWGVAARLLRDAGFPCIDEGGHPYQARRNSSLPSSTSAMMSLTATR